MLNPARLAEAKHIFALKSYQIFRPLGDFFFSTLLPNPGKKCPTGQISGYGEKMVCFEASLKRVHGGLYRVEN